MPKDTGEKRLDFEHTTYLLTSNLKKGEDYYG